MTRSELPEVRVTWAPVHWTAWFECSMDLVRRKGTPSSHAALVQIYLPEWTKPAISSFRSKRWQQYSPLFFLCVCVCVFLSVLTGKMRCSCPFTQWPLALLLSLMALKILLWAAKLFWSNLVKKEASLDWMSCIRYHETLLQRMLHHECWLKPGLHCFGVIMSVLVFVLLNHDTQCSCLTVTTCSLKEQYFPVFSLCAVRCTWFIPIIWCKIDCVAFARSNWRIHSL